MLERFWKTQDYGAHASTVHRLASELAVDAAQRDQAGGTAWEQRHLLRESQLLSLSVPVEYGGPGEPWPLIYRIIRRLAAADGSLAHLFGFQHLQIASVVLYGNEQQKRRLLDRTLTDSAFWGNATNGLDQRLLIHRGETGLFLDGQKSFCSGATDSDMLNLTAVWAHDPTQRVFISLPTTRAGIRILDDWDNIGQRQTDSGTVIFDRVELSTEEILGPPGTAGTPRATLRPLVSQLILTEILIGNALGAVGAAIDYTVNSARPWMSSGLKRSADDPHIQRRYGHLWSGLHAACALSDSVQQRLQGLWEAGVSVSAEQRGELAIDVFQAKAFAARTALDVTAEVFDSLGARSTTRSLGLGRFWRNVRTHSLHDSLDYKYQDIGKWLIDGDLPVPSLYS
jgi:alkylation response protein AidB-like acyl-CoA dehydrogenase